MLDERLPISVSELNEYVRVKLANDPLLRSVDVTGEISGYKRHVSGHHYFVLKDGQARVSCAFFRQYAQSLNFMPEDGMRVTVRASASLFVRDGAYQLYVSSMRREGAGELFLRFEALKRKLSGEGLFDEARKRPLPALPRTIGIVTSMTGAAVRDMVRIARRRNPNVGILIAPCAVQGASAAGEITAAIEALNAQGEAEVLLVGRGGGSMEDLWAFNEEPVARAIVNSRIPVISCVGHETDFTIADFAADARAATPSMAAELAVPVVGELSDALAGLAARLAVSLKSGQALRRARLERLVASQCLREPLKAIVKPRAEAVAALRARMENLHSAQMDRRLAKLSELARTLSAVNPEGVLDRGYAVITKNGKFVQRAEALAQGDEIVIKMSDGAVSAGVLEVG